MKLSLLVSLLVLSTTLLNEAQGIRLGIKVSIPSSIHKIFQKEASGSDNNNGGKTRIGCSKDSCSGLMIRKLMSKPPTSTSTTTTTSKNHAINGANKDDRPVPAAKEENLSFTKYREATQEGYPEIIDIAEMDYSPARRKPPIHN